MFYAFAAVAVAGGVGVVVFRNPLHSALSLLVSFLAVAALFVLRHAEFLAAVQILVYAGGILVLFLFVIMLVNVKELDAGSAFLSRQAPIAVLAGVLFGVILCLLILTGTLAGIEGDGAALRALDGENVGNTEALGWTLYTKYLVPFEVISVLLLVAMIGAIVFGRRDAALAGNGEAGR
ncbi:MAG: NADH-quinone oxidoreductase subunit J [bacterium]|nr:NADH-quinone oxidoreductase subunit J [bacterium]